MKLNDFYRAAKTRLQHEHIETPALDARLLICHGLDLTHEQFVLSDNRVLSAMELQSIETFLQQRLDGKPVSKIIGRKEFYGRDFKTTADTLDPRPDSETLIETVLSHPCEAPLILDLGTGTGCLVLTLLAEWSKARAIAVDQSIAALQIAKENALRIGVEDRVVFIQSDWFSEVIGQFDVIISNPPYIPQGDIAGLAREVRDYDPMAALTGGADGLDPYRVIIPQLPGFLKSGGLAAFEIGQGQESQVADLLGRAGFSAVGVRRDLGGIGRVVHGIYLQNPAEKL